MTKKELKEAIELNKHLKQIEEQLDNLECNNISSPILRERVQTSIISDTTGNIALRLVELKQLYEEQWDQLIELKIRIERAISCLTATEQMLMRYRYIDGLKWEEVCVKMGYSWKQTHRIHSECLKNMT